MPTGSCSPFAAWMAHELERVGCLTDARARSGQCGPATSTSHPRPETRRIARPIRVPLIHAHTSGHATLRDLQRLVLAFDPQKAHSDPHGAARVIRDPTSPRLASNCPGRESGGTYERHERNDAAHRDARSIPTVVKRRLSDVDQSSRARDSVREAARRDRGSFRAKRRPVFDATETPDRAFHGWEPLCRAAGRSIRQHRPNDRFRRTSQRSRLGEERRASRTRLQLRRPRARLHENVPGDHSRMARRQRTKSPPTCSSATRDGTPIIAELKLRKTKNGTPTALSRLLRRRHPFVTASQRLRLHNIYDYPLVTTGAVPGCIRNPLSALDEGQETIGPQPRQRHSRRPHRNRTPSLRCYGELSSCTPDLKNSRPIFGGRHGPSRSTCQ